MRYSTIFFDLDDTLYPSSIGLWQAIKDRMSTYMAERLGLSWDEIPELRRSYYQKYGTTMRGLQTHYGIDPDEYLEYVHDLPLEHYLQPNLELREMLLSLPQQRWVFTNASAGHAGRVLGQLTIQDCFAGIIDVRAIDFACKPETIAYQRALATAGENDPTRCVLVDDSDRNLAPARQLGFTTVLVGNSNLAGTDSDSPTIIPDILSLRDRVPVLWERVPWTP